MTNTIQIIHVVAMDNGRCIGKDNTLLWHIPADLQHFKNITSGGHIIMGRKTFESLGRPLPNRTHYIISRDDAFKQALSSKNLLNLFVFDNIQSAIDTAKTNASNDNQSKIFVIGGGEIYKQTLHQADILEITHVDIQKDGDTFYPIIDDKFSEVWRSDRQTDEKSGLNFYFARYQRQ